jgi:hypothetical protein
MFSHSPDFLPIAPQSNAQESEKVAFTFLLWHFWAQWRDSGPTVGSKFPPNPRTVNLPRTVSCYNRKTCPGGPPKGRWRQRRRPPWALETTLLWQPGRAFREGKRTFWHRGYFAGPEKQLDFSHVAASWLKSRCRASCARRCARDCGGSTGTLDPVARHAGVAVSSDRAADLKASPLPPAPSG